MDKLTLDFPLSIGSLLSHSWAFYKKNFATIALIILVVYVPINTVLELSASLPAPESTSIWQTIRNQVRLGSALEQYIGILATIAIAFVVRASLNGDSLKPKEALKQATANWGKTVLTGILLSLRISLWSLLFIIPGIIFGIYWSFGVMASIFTDKKNGSAMEYSKEMVKGRWWKVFFYNLFFWLPIVFIYPILAIPFALLSQSVVGSIISDTIGDVVVAYFTVVSIFFFLRLDKDTIHPQPVLLTPISDPKGEQVQTSPQFTGTYSDTSGSTL